MKKKQIVFTLLVIMLTLPVVFMNCGGDDDDDKDEDIVGTWEYKMTRKEYANASEGMLTEEMLEEMGVPAEFVVYKIVFAADNSYKVYEVDPKDGTETLEDSGTYTADGNKITNESGGTGTISGNKLTLTEDGETVTLTKK